MGTVPVQILKDTTQTRLGQEAVDTIKQAGADPKEPEQIESISLEPLPREAPTSEKTDTIVMIPDTTTVAETPEVVDKTRDRESVPTIASDTTDPATIKARGEEKELVTGITNEDKS